MSLERKIATMSVSEKVQLALHGNRDARQLLMRDRAGVVQSSLVRNPKITLDEVQALARAPQLAPDTRRDAGAASDRTARRRRSRWRWCATRARRCRRRRS